MIFTHQGAYWVDGMPRDFRVSYPKTLKEYQEEGEKMTADLGGAVYTPGIREIGPGFFEDIFTPAIEKAQKDNVPLYCGEYGVIEHTDPNEEVTWYKDINAALEKHGIPRAAWSYRRMDFGLEDQRLDGVRDELLKYL